jgi:hypothetical protein
MKVCIFINSINLDICVVAAQMKLIIHYQHPIKVMAVKALKEQFENTFSE